MKRVLGTPKGPRRFGPPEGKRPAPVNLTSGYYLCDESPVCQFHLGLLRQLANDLKTHHNHDAGSDCFLGRVYGQRETTT